MYSEIDSGADDFDFELTHGKVVLIKDQSTFNRAVVLGF